MSTEHGRDPLARRSFLSRVSAGAAAWVAVFGAAPASAAASASAGAGIAARPLGGVTADAASNWQPARHPEDDWFDQTTAKHRFFFDTAGPEAFGQALGWARNFLEASISGYKLKDEDNAVIICARHRSTPFAYSDAMWAKYGPELSERSNNFVDPKTKQVPTTNLYLAGAVGGDEGRGANNSLDALIKRGVRLAVCGMATRRAATLIAKNRSLNVDDVLKELSANLVPNAHIVAAGIVAVNRAQERGYTAATVA